MKLERIRVNAWTKPYSWMQHNVNRVIYGTAGLNARCHVWDQIVLAAHACRVGDFAADVITQEMKRRS